MHELFCSLRLALAPLLGGSLMVGAQADAEARCAKRQGQQLRSWEKGGMLRRQRLQGTHAHVCPAVHEAVWHTCAGKSDTLEHALSHWTDFFLRRRRAPPSVLNARGGKRSQRCLRRRQTMMMMAYDDDGLYDGGDADGR